MPRPSQQRPPANGQTTRPPVRQVAARPDPRQAGSVLSEAVPVGDIRDLYVKMLLYGENGAGKTKLACEFPKPLLLVSFEPGESGTGGARTVMKVPGVEYLRVLPTKDDGGGITEVATSKFLRLADEFRKGFGRCNLADPKYYGKPFETVVVDSVTSLQDRVLAEILGLDWVPPQITGRTVTKDQWTARAESTKECLRPWLDLPVHTVFVAKETDHYRPEEPERDDKGKIKVDMRAKFVRELKPQSRFGPLLGGGTAGWLMDGCDYICRLYMDQEMESIEGVAVTTGRYTRVLRIGFHPNYAARFRSADYARLPDAIVAPTFDKILAAIEGKLTP